MWQIVPILLLSIPLLATTLNEKQFPAITNDGNYLLLLHSRESCCVEQPRYFQIHEVTTDKVLKNIQLTTGNQNQEFKPLSKNIKEVNKLLLKYPAQKLKSLKSFSWKPSKLKDEGVLTVTNQKKIIFNQKLKLSRYSLPHMVCGNPPGKSCYFSPQIRTIWYAPKQKLLLIEYGLLGVMDGAEDGPHYRIISLK